MSASFAFAQKKEIQNASKAIEKNDIAAAKTEISKAEGLLNKGGPMFAWSMALMAIEFIIAIICLPTYAVLASSARKILTRGTVAAWMERVLGGVLVGFEVRVAVG